MSTEEVKFRCMQAAGRIPKLENLQQKKQLAAIGETFLICMDMEGSGRSKKENMQENRLYRSRGTAELKKAYRQN